MDKKELTDLIREIVREELSSLATPTSKGTIISTENISIARKVIDKLNKVSGLDFFCNANNISVIDKALSKGYTESMLLKSIDINVPGKIPAEMSRLYRPTKLFSLAKLAGTSGLNS